MKKSLNKETIKQKAINIGLFSFLTILLSSCVMVYNTSDLRRNIDQTVNQANDTYNDAKKDFEEKNKIYRDLKENTLDLSQNPFNAISQEQKKLDVIKSEHLKGIHPIVTIKNIKNLFRIKGFNVMKFFSILSILIKTP